MDKVITDCSKSCKGNKQASDCYIPYNVKKSGRRGDGHQEGIASFELRPKDERELSCQEPQE